MTLAERVKLKRKELGLTQEELAHRMGYKSRVSVNKIEMGRPITQKIIVKLAEALDTSPSYLMGWEEEDNKKDVNYNNIGNDCSIVENTKDEQLSRRYKKWQERIGYDITFTEEEIDEIINFALYLISKRK